MMYRIFLAGIFLMIIIVVLFVGYTLSPTQRIENPNLVPSYAYYRGPYNIAGTPTYSWEIHIIYEFTDREAAARFYESVTTWENMEPRRKE